MSTHVPRTHNNNTDNFVMRSYQLANPTNLSVIVLIGAFLFLACSCITVIGLNYDETMFVNAALGGINDDVIFKRLFGIPVMVLPDQGALKSYLYYPIFKIFGVTTLSIRVPAILISAFALFIWFKIGKKLLENNYYALILLALMATDPTFIIFTKADTSPFVLQTFFMALTVFFYLRFNEDNSIKFLALSCLTIIAGLLNKISFLWFTMGFLYVVMLYHRENIILLYQRHQAKTRALFVFFIGALFFITVFMIIPPLLGYPMGIGDHKLTVIEKIPIVIKLYLETLNGNYRYFGIFFKNLDYKTLINVIEIPCLLLWLTSLSIVHIFKIENAAYERYKKPILFFLMLLVIDFLFLLFTPQTYTPGHIMVLWPLPHIVFVLMLAALISLFTRKIVLLTLLQMTPFALILSQCYVNYEYDTAFRKPSAYQRYIWMPAIYQLSAYVNQHADTYDNVISGDIGMNTQLFALAKNNQERLKIHELWAMFSQREDIKKCVRFLYPFFLKSDAENLQWMYVTFYKGKHNLVIVFTETEMASNAKQGFFDFAELYHIKVAPLAIIDNGAGRQIYSLYTADG